MNREQWLVEIKNLMAPKFIELGAPLPERIRMSCGFCQGQHAIGQCWKSNISDGEFTEIFIRPDRHESVDVAAILFHELIHAALPDAGHGKDFKRVALAAGLKPPMTATTPGASFIDYVKPLIDKIGEYPHSKLDFRQPKPKKTGESYVNLRCGKCNFFAKTITEMMEIARLKCPVCPDELLLTPKERKQL